MHYHFSLKFLKSRKFTLKLLSKLNLSAERQELQTIGCSRKDARCRLYDRQGQIFSGRSRSWVISELLACRKFLYADGIRILIFLAGNLLSVGMQL